MTDGPGGADDAGDADDAGELPPDGRVPDGETLVDVGRGVGVVVAGVYNSGLLARPRPGERPMYNYAPAPPELLARVIRAAHDGTFDLDELGRRGREYVVAEADREVAVSRYGALLLDLVQ